jgi:hypothetical protein
MSKIRAIETNEAENDETEVDPIEVIYQGECPSISGRSTLTYAIGRHSEDGKLHLAITGNSGGGMWCKDWASASAIQDVVLGEGDLTAKSFHPLHAGRSINTAGFILAALKELGAIRAKEENTRLHEHIPTTTFEQLVMAHIGVSQEPAPKPGRRKAKGG